MKPHIRDVVNSRTLKGFIAKNFVCATTLHSAPGPQTSCVADVLDGCMGKIFGNSGQSAAPAEQHFQSSGCYRQSCCHGHIPSYGYNQNAFQGERSSSASSNMYRPCMGRCNPPKLYSDTYGYLNQNLMQPTIKEVYQDLKSITPANTVMNNPMASQMGFKAEFAGQGNYGGVGTPTPFHKTTSNETDNSAMSLNNINQMDQYGGMGPQIMNMLGGNIANPNSTGHKTGQLAKPMVIDAPQSHGKVGVTPFSTHLTNPYAVQANVTNQYTNQPNMQPNANSQNIMSGNQQLSPINANHSLYGQHSHSIAKFNDMFPGVMKNDLGFDPMAIAIQMNPANQKQSSMDSIHKIMSNNNDMNSNFDKNANTSHLETANMHNNLQQSQIQNIPPREVYREIIPMNKQGNFVNASQNQKILPNIQHSLQRNDVHRSSVGQSNQQVYSMLTGSPVANQQKPIQHQQPIVVDPTSGTVMKPPNLSTVYEENVPNDAQSMAQNLNRSPNSQQMIKEPIFPADTSKYAISKQKYQGYNTLGQPIEMLSADIYHTPLPSLPQTLSPQPEMKYRNDSAKYSNVKSTISKTSLLATKPMGKTPSKNQLQQIYNQYKGSQSYTQQNIKDQAIKGVSNSERRLRMPPVHTINHQQVPIERIGGDTAANNPIQDQRTNKIEQIIGEIGDVPGANMPFGEAVTQKVVPPDNRKCRNGLQDVVFTSYPTSAAWSFHGYNKPLPSAAYRYRNKI
ncbi:unnamed protein product, partial [Brenthis ino]